jgi:uncharacterized membrane protein YgcG
MDLQANWSLDVHEVIDVNFSEARHGIYREIPIQDAAGEYTHLSHVNVIGDPVADESIINGYYTLKIWSANTIIIGPKQYTIDYTVDNAIKTYAAQTSWWVTTPGWQELYRNIIGTKRATRIDNSSFTLTLPSGYQLTGTNAFLVYGVQGETGRDTISQLSPTKIVWSASRPLNPYEGMTLWIKFPSNYITISSQTEKKFGVVPTLSEWKILWQLIMGFFHKIFNLIGSMIIPVSVGLIMRKALQKQGRISWKTLAWKSEKSITIEYVPPQGTEPSKAFWFWYRASNPRVFTALVYYRATRGRVNLARKKDSWLFWLFKTDAFHVIEKQLKPSGTTPLEDITLQSFFGTYDQRLDDIVIDQSAYSEVTDVMDNIQASIEKNNTLYTKSWFIFTKYTLTDEWEKLFEHLRGYKEFLNKVDRPQIERILKDDPDFISTILPWSILFGVETKLLPIIEDLLQQTSAWWYSSYDGRPLLASSFRTMNAAMVSSSTAPRSSGWSSGSGFSSGGWGWFSGWGWGGGGGWSW